MMDELEQGSSLNLEQIWAMVRRGRWWIILPLFLWWITVWGVSWLLPTTYESEAQILVEQQKVPEQYVLSNVNMNIEERLQSMTQKILSRTKLQQIIDRYELYPNQKGIRKLFQSADPVEQMRKDIKIELVQPPGKPADLTAFKLVYDANTAELAQRVNAELAGQFIDESVNLTTCAFAGYDKVPGRTSSSRLRRIWNEKEEAVRDFKGHHVGRSPESTSKQRRNSLRSTSRNSRAYNMLLMLPSNRNCTWSRNCNNCNLFLGSMGGDVGPSPLETLQKELLGLKADLATERSRHTDDYPDIVALKGKIAETEKMIKDMKDTSRLLEAR